jgi:hypothetical protein
MFAGHCCRSADSEAGLCNLNKALRGIRALLDDRIRTLRKQQEFDADANIARQLQAELEQEDIRRQVGLAWRRMPGATVLLCPCGFPGTD